MSESDPIQLQLRTDGDYPLDGLLRFVVMGGGTEVIGRITARLRDGAPPEPGVLSVYDIVDVEWVDPP